ncbi:MAG TPA: CBS domain-containing protein [Methylomirabilota bacterium]|jgi:acetoin utilization protein AcuB|nr:CBS domain-containing protein [Methylomirabilota bacterium]
MQVKELMSRELVTIGPKESCLDAVVRMQRARVRHLPVVNRDGLLVGIVTDRDLRHHLFTPRVFEVLGSTPVDVLLDGVRVAEIMATDVMTVEAGASVGDAAGTMRKHRVGSLPVMENGRMVGIVTEVDILRQIVRADATTAPECAEIIVSYP